MTPKARIRKIKEIWKWSMAYRISVCIHDSKFIEADGTARCITCSKILNDEK